MKKLFFALLITLTSINVFADEIDSLGIDTIQPVKEYKIYKQPTESGKLLTIALPYKIEKIEGGYLYEINGKDSNSVTIDTPIDTIAGGCYIVRATDDTVKFYMDSTFYSSEPQNDYYYPNYNNDTINCNFGNYILSNNRFARVGNNIVMTQYHWSIDINNVNEIDNIENKSQVIKYKSVTSDTNNVKANIKSTTIIKDGIVYIVTNNHIYTLDGKLYK